MTPGTKLGPLPAWAWGLVILGGLGLGLYLRRHSSSSPTASLVSAGGPVGALGSGGGGSDGGGTGATSTGMDPLLAQLLSDSSSALVNESGVFAGLAAESVQGALDAANGALSLASTVALTPPVVYTIGASAAGSSPAGTSPMTTTPTTPIPTAPYAAPAAPAAPNLSTARVGTTGTVVASGGVVATVDETGHVVSPKGTRVGGFTLVG